VPFFIICQALVVAESIKLLKIYHLIGII